MRMTALDTWRVLSFAIVAACGDSPETARDAGDAEPSADADERDASVVDAAPDAYLSPLPACTTPAATLLDVSPREIGDLALSGDVLYVAAYELADTGDISNSAILSLDLTTGDEAFAPVMLDTADAALVAVGDDVYASIRTAGTIMRLRPGVAPATVVSGRPLVGTAVTADATHLYWSEQETPGDTDVIKRRLLGGGTVSDVVECDQATQLFVVGNDLYCVAFNGSVRRVAKDGSGQVASFGASSYPLVSAILDGAELYLAGFSVYPQLFRMTLPAGPFALVHEEAAVGRFTGLAATGLYFYVTHMDQGIRRYRRSDLDTTLIAPDYVRVGDPVIWNDRLYYATGSFTDADHHWLKHCVD